MFFHEVPKIFFEYEIFFNSVSLVFQFLSLDFYLFKFTKLRRLTHPQFSQEHVQS